MIINHEKTKTYHPAFFALFGAFFLISTTQSCSYCHKNIDKQIQRLDSIVWTDPMYVDSNLQILQQKNLSINDSMYCLFLNEFVHFRTKGVLNPDTLTPIAEYYLN